MPPVSEKHVDRLLGVWARQQRLADTEAESIRQAIVQEPPPLPAGWWRDFTAQIGWVVRQATSTPTFADPGIRAAFLAADSRW